MARLDLDEAIRLNTAYANAYQNRAALRYATGDKAGAIEDWNKFKGLVR